MADIMDKYYAPLKDPENVIPILNKISILGGLNDEQLHAIFALLKTVSYVSGEVIFNQGGEPSFIYIIRSGNVKIAVSEENTCFELIVFGQGQCFGETSILGIQSHSASALAIGETELIVLSREALLSLFETDKELFGLLILNIAREACRRLHSADETLLHYVLKNK